MKHVSSPDKCIVADNQKTAAETDNCHNVSLRTGKRDREGRFAVDNQTDGMKNDNDKNIKTRYDISKKCFCRVFS